MVLFLMAHSFQWEYGHDYDETFVYEAHMTIVHTLLIVPPVCHLSKSELDVMNVFLKSESHKYRFI